MEAGSVCSAWQGTALLRISSVVASTNDMGITAHIRLRLVPFPDSLSIALFQCRLRCVLPPTSRSSLKHYSPRVSVILRNGRNVGKARWRRETVISLSRDSMEKLVLYGCMEATVSPTLYRSLIHFPRIFPFPASAKLKISFGPAIFPSQQHYKLANAFLARDSKS